MDTEEFNKKSEESMTENRNDSKSLKISMDAMRLQTKASLKTMHDTGPIGYITKDRLR